VARKLEIQILGDIKNFTSELDRAVGKTHRFGAAAKVAGLAIASGLAVGIEQSVKAAMAGQVSQAALDQALKNTHQSVKAMTPALEAAETASRKLGFADDDTRAALAKLETATGDTKKAVVDLGLAEDIARFKHVDLDAASKMLTSTLAGNSRAAKQLGLIIIPVTEHMDALKAKYKDLGTAIPVAEAAQARFLDKQATGVKTLQDVTDKVHGQAQAFTDTPAGGMAQFHAQVQHIEESLGTLLLPAVKAVATGLANLTAVVSGHKTAFEVAAAAVGALAAAFGIATVAQWAFDTAAQANPYILIAEGVVVAVAALVILEEKFHFVETAVGALKDAFQTVKDWFTNSWAAVSGLVSGPLDAIKTALQPVIDLLKGDWSGAWTDTKNLVKDVLDAVKKTLDTALAGIGTAALAVGTKIYDKIKEGVKGIADAVGGFLGDIGDKLTGGVTSIAGDAAKFAGGILSGFESGLAGFGKMLERLIKAPLNAIIGAWNSIALDFTLPSIDTHIPGVGKIGGQHVGFSVPQIAQLAAGGIVTMPTLALIGERGPEAVVPLGRAGAGGAGGATVNYTLNFPNYLGDPNQLATHMIQLLQKHAASGPAGSPYRTY
jgi:hypothetical protein